MVESRMELIVMQLHGGERGWAWRIIYPTCPELIRQNDSSKTVCNILINSAGLSAMEKTCTPAHCPRITAAIEAVDAMTKEAGNG